MERLFVYGTLAPGKQNFHLVEAINGTWEAAYCFGRVFTQTKGAHVGLPCFELSTSGARVSGMMLSSTELPQYWKMLDTFEGELYHRQLVSVDRETGGSVKAYVYVNGDVPCTE